MSGKRYAEEFKMEAVKQITERRYPVAGVSVRLGVSQHSLCKWVKKYSQPSQKYISTCPQPRQNK